MNKAKSIYAQDIWVLLAALLVAVVGYGFDGYLTYDGYYYYELSSIFSSLDFKNWDFARTPLFPFMLFLSEKFNVTNLPNFVFLNSVLIAASLGLLINLLLKNSSEQKGLFFLDQSRQQLILRPRLS